MQAVICVEDKDCFFLLPVLLLSPIHLFPIVLSRSPPLDPFTPCQPHHDAA